MPRSYIGCDDANGENRIWGTGLYKVNMTLNESCDINMDFYYDDKKSTIADQSVPIEMGNGVNRKNEKHHWNYHWSEEWKRIKHRKHTGNNIFSNIWEDVKVQYSNSKWINVLVDPVTTVILSSENEFLSDRLNDWLKLGEKSSNATK